MEIVLVRHAQPDWEPAGLAVDHPALTPYGAQQAQAVAKALADESFDHLYVSPLERARATAAPIAAALGLEPEVQSWLAELRLPSLQGATSDQVQDFFAKARARDLESWWEAAGPGGESFRHFYERVSGGLESLLTGPHGADIHEHDAHRLWQIPQPDRRLLIVAHEGTNAIILSHLLGIEPVSWAYVRFSTIWCGITRIRTMPIASGRVWVLRRFNADEHLAPLGPPP